MGFQPIFCNLPLKNSHFPDDIIHQEVTSFWRENNSKHSKYKRLIGILWCFVLVGLSCFKTFRVNQMLWFKSVLAGLVVRTLYWRMFWNTRGENERRNTSLAKNCELRKNQSSYSTKYIYMCCHTANFTFFF